MKKILNFFFTLFLFIILFNFNVVLAKDITVDEVISYMNQNSIFDDAEYNRLFSTMFNGEDEYEMGSLKYIVTKESDTTLKVKVDFEDKKTSTIEKEFTLTLANNSQISYTNTNESKSLESRLLTFIFNEIIYSVGGARGYNKDYLFDWMNQIDLENATLEDDGVVYNFEQIFYTIDHDGTNYEYEFDVPKNFSIDINKITNEIPELITAEIHDINPGFTDISMKIFVQNHTDELCNVYRREDGENDYQKIAQVRCNDEEFVDKDVEVGKTYYYKATVDGVIMCSDEVEASLEVLPLTGAFLSIGSILALIIIELFICKYYKKFKKLRKV